jgi:hypothetical protein
MDDPKTNGKPPGDRGLPRQQRSAVSNGRRLFVVGDGNSAWSRRFKDRIFDHVSDMGGHDAVSVSEESLIRRASAIECALEAMEGRLSLGEDVDMDEFQRLTNTLRRTLQVLGLERRPRDVTSFGQLLRADRITEAAE